MAPPVPATHDRQVRDLSFLLNHAAHVLATKMNAAFAEIGMTPRAYCVLKNALAGEYTQIELAKIADSVHHGGIVAIVEVAPPRTALYSLTTVALDDSRPAESVTESSASATSSGRLAR